MLIERRSYQYATGYGMHGRVYDAFFKATNDVSSIHTNTKYCAGHPGREIKTYVAAFFYGSATLLCDAYNKEIHIILSLVTHQFEKGQFDVERFFGVFENAFVEVLKPFTTSTSRSVPYSNITKKEEVTIQGE